MRVITTTMDDTTGANYYNNLLALSVVEGFSRKR